MPASFIKLASLVVAFLPFPLCGPFLQLFSVLFFALTFYSCLTLQAGLVNDCLASVQMIPCSVFVSIYLYIYLQLNSFIFLLIIINYYCPSFIDRPFTFFHSFLILPIELRWLSFLLQCLVAGNPLAGWNFN